MYRRRPIFQPFHLHTGCKFVSRVSIRQTNCTKFVPAADFCSSCDSKHYSMHLRFKVCTLNIARYTVALTVLYFFHCQRIIRINESISTSCCLLERKPVSYVVVEVHAWFSGSLIPLFFLIATEASIFEALSLPFLERFFASLSLSQPA